MLHCRYHRDNVESEQIRQLLILLMSIVILFTNKLTKTIKKETNGLFEFNN